MRFEVTFMGRVQGVGFRAAAQDVARDLGVTGWIRNEPDGAVKLVAEGPEEQIQTFLDRIRQRVGQYITSESIETGDDRGGYSGFEIRY